ncbi:polysialoglycoprotein-like [Papaver somniferum]|uniref:polysialoglycoprotein-like n=1 Tax=Papaver somniferum TaxID=3469 RepID=UPI000E6F6097|nr:polysialoglycoprotein-like [Papaver somniferum]
MKFQQVMILSMSTLLLLPLLVPESSSSSPSGVDHQGSSSISPSGVDHHGSASSSPSGVDHQGSSSISPSGVDHQGSSSISPSGVDHHGSSSISPSGVDHHGSPSISPSEDDDQMSLLENLLAALIAVVVVLGPWLLLRLCFANLWVCCALYALLFGLFLIFWHRFEYP